MAGWLGRALGRKRLLRLPPDAADAAAEQLLVMDEALEAIVDLPGLDEVLETRALPHGFLGLWRRALAAYDEYVKLTLHFANGGEGLRVRCEIACHGCCHDAPTGVQAIELLAIHHAYRSFADFEQVHDAACDSADVLLEELKRVAPGSADLRGDDRRSRRALLAYRARTRPCVFLDPGSRKCRIYELRPISCRMHFSVSDPELCWPGHPRARHARTHDIAPPEIIVQSMKEIARRMDLEHLSPVLFQGLAWLGGELPSSAPLTEAAPRERLRRRKDRDGGV